MSDCFICVRNQALQLSGKSSFQSKATISSILNTKLSSICKLRVKPQQLSIVKSNLNSTGKINNKINVGIKLENTHLNGSIKAWLKVDGNAKTKTFSISSFNNKYIDKFAGSISGLLSLSNYTSIQKLYPISDEVISLNNSYFVDKQLSSGNLYQSIDEGLFTGNYIEHLNQSNRISDDNLSYIQPSSIFTSGTFRYKCGVTRPIHHPENSFLFIRASAPTSNYGANVPPEYRIHNIILEDPSGNTIIKYKDITLKGDDGYTTYITEPEINNAKLNSWESNYPILSEPSGYKLNLDFDVICLDDPFTEGFNFGYEEKACELKFVNTSNQDYLSLDGSPLSTQTQGYHLNPTNSIRISAIEICNSGNHSISGVKLENYFSFYTEVDIIGQRLSRTLYPVEILTNNYDIDIYPESYTLWQSSEYYDDESIVTANNASISGSKILTNFINNLSTSDYITLTQTSPISDSGRLTLRFSHKAPEPFVGLRDGAFDLSVDRQFNKSKYTKVEENDNFFMVDSIELKIVAKKQSGTRDYVLDVVGYSDDRLLNITPKVGAFLQNKHEVYYLTDENANQLVTENQNFLVTQNQSIGQVPLTSGFKPVNDLGISSESLSDKDQYYESYLTSIDAGDHYKLSTLPVVDSTIFKEYTIPLEIYEDYVNVGKSNDYSLSSYFENLYIDLFPIPSGASISSIQLVVKYKPSNGIMLHTLGTPQNKELGRKDINLLPVGYTGINDIKLNSEFEDGVLSLVSGIPQGYKEPTTLKTNYARRWRGVDGNIVNGPYDPNQFDFSFYNPQSDHPFLYGYYDLNNTSGNWIISSDYATSGYHTGSIQVLKNIGWRFNNNLLFNNGESYRTLDWTTSSDLLYGKISDAFDTAVKTGPDDNSLITFDLTSFPSGAIFYIRFTPSEDVTDYTSIINTGRFWILVYEDSISLSIDSAEPIPFLPLSGIQYPLSLLCSYNKNNDNVSIYCRNEIDNSSDLVFFSGSLPVFDTGLVPLTFGSDANGSLFIHEIGISLSGNIVDSNPNRLLKQTTVQSFLDGHSHYFNNSASGKFNLPSYIDDNTSLWKLGDFKICSFSPDFDGFTTRIGKDYLIHKLKHSGSGYAVTTNLPLPSNVLCSGLSYHSQIENDFLRFNLQDIPDSNPNFYSTAPRICKTLPRGYDFTERALVVDTIVEHETANNIVWEDGSIGPKLIVSLYSKNQDPVNRPSKVNWGLINRSIHYLKPSGCYEKLNSTFNYNDLIDVSEPWALFDLDNIRSEFDQKYYSTDINDMFLQYDLVYPSGSPFESTIKIHSANVRLENSLTYWDDRNQNVNLYSTGDNIRFTDMSLYTISFDYIRSQVESGYFYSTLDGLETKLNVQTITNNFVVPAIFKVFGGVDDDILIDGNVYEDGKYPYYGPLNGSHEYSYEALLQPGQSIAIGGRDNGSGGSISGTWSLYGYASPLVLYTAGSPWESYNDSINLFSYGVGGIPEESFNLFVKNSGTVSELGPELYVLGGQSREEENLSLVMIDNTLDQTRFGSIDLFVKNTAPVYLDDSLLLSMGNGLLTVDLDNTSRMNLVTFNDQIIVSNLHNNFNLYINTDLGYTSLSGNFNLFTINYLAYNQNLTQQAAISWNSSNLGFDINPILDADVPYLEANDEIRGVDLLCYGDCSGQKSCNELPINLHDIDWYGENSCIDGGIFRVKNTYTNLAVSGFKTPIGYSGNFYGIRKYTGLVPNSAYNVTVSTKSGSAQSIELPTQFIELDYGSNDEVNYSGIKLVADNSERQAGNKYGKSVAVKNDLIAIGAPMQTVSYSEYDSNSNLITTNLPEAGSVFLYRRSSQPSGYSWLNDKGSWSLEEKITLPSGLLKDYPTIVQSNTINGIPLPEPISRRYWNVGQEGRQFGHSLDLAINEDMTSFEENKREILVVGGPSAKWNRDFEDLNVSGVSIGLLVFTDEFRPSWKEVISRDPLIIRTKDYNLVLNAIQDKDLVFRYFCDPPIKFDVKLIICEPIADNTNTTNIDFPEPKPPFIVKQRIPRNVGIVDENDKLAVFSGIKTAFETAFPYDTNKLHNNIPVMLGVYVDNSRSLGRRAVSPGLDEFLSYYQQYSFASGLQDFYNVPSSGAIYEYNAELANSEDWIQLSITALNELLDTGRLVQSDQVRFLASEVGSDAFNANLSEFNYPPTSGGRVYIFEKESGSWNLIQEIKSPNNNYGVPDRFGHSVAISKDSKVIAIGSPYINDCCKVFEYKPLEKERLYNGLYSWLQYQNSLLGGDSARYLGLIDDYSEWLEDYGYNYANKILYSHLTSTEKFQARDYLDINEYEDIFTYSYSDIPYVGNDWKLIPEKFAPTSRLGYSAAVNEDGSIVAFGAPTDSFNAFDDYNVYYKNNGYNDPLNIDQINGSILSSWRSNVNSGAVRLFESRAYYPHSKVVEFGKFGNLHESLGDPLDSGHFDYLSDIFNDKSFRKMTESEVSLPQDAGLAFIITPGEDALSEEIISNIISWLSLGDRNLVLVGNDPTWESSGVYKQSNDILNRLLAALNSKVRLHSARNQYESLPSGNSIVIPSFKPANGTTTFVRSETIGTACGVGDIRMHMPNFKMFMPCTAINIDGEEVPFTINTKCELPLVDGGDLRAQWYDECIGIECQDKKIQYAVNWPFVFKTFDPGCCSSVLDVIDEGRFDLRNQDPVPLLVAAEDKIQTRILPAVPAVYRNVPIQQSETFYTTTTIYEFDPSNISPSSSFIWNSGSKDYLSYQSNLNNSNGALWFTPEQFGSNSGILQAKAYLVSQPVIGTQVVSDVGLYCAEEIFGTSKIIAIANTISESQNALYKSGFSDSNINFYSNIVSKNVTGGSNIAQLGGWTGRTSFKDGYSDSILEEIFTNTGNDVYLNVEHLSPVYDVCWIANPINTPSQEEVNQIITWLGLGNKKLVITHDSTLPQIIIAEAILSLINSHIKPLYLTVKERYASVQTNNLTFNANNPVSIGFNTYPISNFSLNYAISFVPFATVENVNNICFNNEKVYDDKLITDSFFRMYPGVDKVSFPAIPGSGYSLFIDYVTDSSSETYPLDLYINNVSKQPSLPYPQNIGFTTYIPDLDNTIKNDPEFKIDAGERLQLTSTAKNKIATISTNVQVLQNKNTIDIYFHSLAHRIDNTSFTPKTPKIVSISGVLLPIATSTSRRGETYTTTIGWKLEKVSDPIPETVISENFSGPITSLNDKYCVSECLELGLGNQYIADGPVVASQEIESVSTFDAGFARSRITVISDSSLVQGRYMVDEFGRMSPETVSFIRSLYPETNFPSTNNGKQFNTFTKIVGPERGSPQKYGALKNKVGSTIRFGSVGSSGPDAFNDKESLYHPRYVRRLDPPWINVDGETAKQLKDQAISEFINEEIIPLGGSPSFSGIIDTTTYVDAGLYGGIPQLMIDKGYDYLDFDYMPSGYPGDLFGFSIALYKNKLIVGSPFSAFSDEVIHPWSYYENNFGSDGIELSDNGGAGAVYIYEKTYNGSGIRNTKTPWEFIQKLRPDNINIGYDYLSSVDSQSYNKLGPNSYSSGNLVQWASITDQFGYDVSIDSDIIAVGCPGHDFSKNTENVYDSGCFIRKAFNDEFDIPSRLIVDLGNSGIRASIQSGICVLNNGAIFMFENSISDWATRSQKWKFIEKVTQQGINTRQQNTNENDYFGRSVYVNRSLRSDADYVIIGGAENHDYSSSGTNSVINAGAAYTNDIMLRGSSPAMPNQNTYIDVKVFGELGSSNDPLIRVITDNSTFDQNYYTSGVIYSNKDGAIFLEASGQDPSVKGFIQHRPYVVSVDGLYRYGTNTSGDMPLFIDGYVDNHENMNLFVVASTGNVYNNLGLYSSSIVDFGSGVLNFYTDCPDPTNIFESGLPLFTASGIGISTDYLNMRIRGY